MFREAFSLLTEGLGLYITLLVILVVFFVVGIAGFIFLPKLLASWQFYAIVITAISCGIYLEWKKEPEK